MSYFKFKPKDLDAHIVFSYHFDKSKKKIVLKQINIFKTDFEVQKLIKQEKLNPQKEGAILEQQIIKNIQNLFYNYFKGDKISIYSEIQKLELDLDLDSKFKTPFSKKVMNELLNIEPGKTTSYSEIGKSIGTKAYRAIGNACKSNPLPLIIPCHRVLRKSGEIGGFMGSIDKDWEIKIKKELLKREGLNL